MEGNGKKGYGAYVDGSCITYVCQVNRMLAFELDFYRNKSTLKTRNPLSTKPSILHFSAAGSKML